MVENVKPTDRLVFDLEMLQVDYNEQKKQSLRKKISEKYGVPLTNVEVNFLPITVTEEGEKLSLASDVINNIQDPKFQQNLFREYIELNNIENISFDDIIEIDNKVNAFVNFDSYSRYKPYKIKYLKWDNYLSYGKGNYFDFTKLHGLVWLTGQPENTCGKTTFAIDLLRFALFGKASKSPTLDSVFNKYLEKETEVVVEAGIEIEGVDYVIRRTITRPSLNKRTSKSKAKQKIEYFKLMDGNYEEIENCEDESATQTNNIIRETVGNIEDFDLVISATAYSLGDLMRMGQTDKGKLFSRWLGLLTIEEKEKIAKDLWKEESKTLLSNRYNKATLESEIKDMQTVIDDDNKQVIVLEDKMNVTNSNIDKCNKQKIDIISNRKEIKQELIKADVTTIENNIRYCNENLEKVRAVMKAKKERFMQIKDVVFDSDKYNALKQEESDIKVAQAELKLKYTTLDEDNKRIQGLIEQKICPTCGHPIDKGEQQESIAKNEAKMDELKAEGSVNKKRLEEIAAETRKLEQMRTEENELNRLKPEMSAIKVQIDNIKLQLSDWNRKKEEIETNKENIKYNNEIDNKIRIVDETIKVETRVKEQLIRDIQTLKSEASGYVKGIEERNTIIKKLTEEETKIRNWNIYNELVGKNGIVKLVLKRALPILNNEIARLINGLCDFEVKLSIDESNKVCLELERDGKKMDLGVAASGWEGCISSIALRCALANIAGITSANYTVYDEVLSGVSSENAENVMKLFHRVLNSYDFILHICHDSSFADYHEQTIEVTKKNNVSSLELK